MFVLVACGRGVECIKADLSGADSLGKDTPQHAGRERDRFSGPCPVRRQTFTSNTTDGVTCACQYNTSVRPLRGRWKVSGGI